MLMQKWETKQHKLYPVDQRKNKQQIQKTPKQLKNYNIIKCTR